MPKSLTGSIVGIQQMFVSSLPLHPTRASIFKKVRTRLSEGLTGNVVMGNRKGLKWWAAESPLTHLGAVSKPAALVPEGPPSPHPPPNFPQEPGPSPAGSGGNWTAPFRPWEQMVSCQGPTSEPGCVPDAAFYGTIFARLCISRHSKSSLFFPQK